VDHSFESELQISNRLTTEPVTVHPVLALDDGSSFPLEAVTLQPSGVATVNLNGAYNALPSSARASHSDFGTIALSYDWHWDGAISAEVQNIDSRRSLSYMSSLRPEPQSDSAAQTIHGLWWKKTAKTGVLLRLTNVTDAPVKALLTVTDQKNQPISQDSVRIAPSQTVLRDIPAVFAAEVTALGGLDISFSGKLGGLLVDGGLEDADNGFSARLVLYAPPSSLQTGKPPKTVTVASTGIMIGKPGDTFPPQVYFRPWLKLRNVSSGQKAVSITGTYMFGFQPVTVPLAPTHFELNGGRRR
jgi:hypothetical protein